eukprot:340140-Pelagomonas_calceolata.AAC.2
MEHAPQDLSASDKVHTWLPWPNQGTNILVRHAALGVQTIPKKLVLLHPLNRLNLWESEGLLKGRGPLGGYTAEERCLGGEPGLHLHEHEGSPHSPRAHAGMLPSHSMLPGAGQACV